MGTDWMVGAHFFFGSCLKIVHTYFSFWVKWNSKQFVVFGWIVICSFSTATATAKRSLGSFVTLGLGLKYAAKLRFVGNNAGLGTIPAIKWALTGYSLI